MLKLLSMYMLTTVAPLRRLLPREGSTGRAKASTMATMARQRHRSTSHCRSVLWRRFSVRSSSRRSTLLK